MVALKMLCHSFMFAILPNKFISPKVEMQQLRKATMYALSVNCFTG